MLFRFLFIIAVVLPCLSFAQERGKMGKDNHLERKRELVEAIQGADQLEVVVPHFRLKLSNANNQRSKVKIKGVENIQGFIDSLKFKENQTGASCACSGTYHLIISKEGKKLASISYQHHIALRWGGKSWIGDSALTEKSIDNMLAWFTKNGFKEPEEHYRQDLADRKARKLRHDYILGMFNKEAQDILNLPNSIFDPLTPNAITEEEKAKRLYESFSNKADFIERACKIMGGQANPQVYNYYESIVADTFKLVSEKDFANFLQRKKEWSDEERRGLKFFLLHQQRLSKPMYAKNSAKIQQLVRLWLTQEHEYDSAINLVNFIFALNIADLNQFFLPYIKGSKVLKVRRGQSISPPINLRYLMILKCAENGDESVKTACNELLKEKNSPIEQSVLKIAKALLDGDLSRLEIKDFEYGVSFLPRSRYLLAKKYPSLKSYDILVAGTSHKYAHHREQSVLAVEALTGKKWYQNKEHERAEWHGKDVRAWWAINRKQYEFPKKK